MSSQFSTKSFPLNELQDAAEVWEIIYPERKVKVIPSHFSSDGSASVFGFAYVQDKRTVADFEKFVEAEIALLSEEWDEADYFPGGELGRAWASESAAEYAKIAQQNAEDAAMGYGAPEYMGVVGRRDGDGGWIFEP